MPEDNFAKARNILITAIRPALNILGKGGRAAEQLVLGTAIQESLLIHRQQLGNGPALGLFQMEPATHNDCWQSYLNFRRDLADKVKRISDMKGMRVVTSQAGAAAWAVGAASVREIDRYNIRGATALALRRALARLRVPVDHVLLDGTALPELGRAHEPIVDGDARCHSIAAASVIAKLVRDRLMVSLGRHYPAFGWERNKGYGTPDHLAALDSGGPTRHHRRSFMPVVQMRLVF